ncbi:MAG: NPCBM/NEW2 domain-containing protein [Phycisphaerae bacterium]
MIHATICFILLAQNAAGTDAAGGVPVAVERLDGGQTVGQLHAIAPDVRLISESGAIESYSLDDLAAIRPLDKPSATSSPQSPFRFELADGSQFSGTIREQAQDRVVVRVMLDGDARVPLDGIRLIRNEEASTIALRRLEEQYAARAKQAAPLPDDELIVAKEDQALVLRGTVRALTADHVSFTWNGREMDVPWSRAAGVLFGRVEPRSSSSVIVMDDGQRFGGQISEGDTKRIVLQSGVFDQFEIPWSRIAEIRLASRRVTYLSDLKPLHYEHKNLLGIAWPYGRDEAIDGGELRLNENKFSRGLVLHSDSRIEYALGGEFQSMTATVGIFDRYPQGVANVRVLGDGRTLWSIQNLQARSPQALQIDISRVRALEIFVESGANLDLGDHVFFADAKLIRKED